MTILLYAIGYAFLAMCAIVAAMVAYDEVTQAYKHPYFRNQERNKRK